MARWTLYQNRNENLTLKYSNVVNGQQFQCGELRHDTPKSMVVDWVASQNVTAPGDIVKFPDGSVVQFLAANAQA